MVEFFKKKKKDESSIEAKKIYKKTIFTKSIFKKIKVYKCEF